MGLPTFYDMDGSTLTYEQWVELMEHRNNLIQKTHIHWKCDILISTIWTGLDMNFLFGPKKIFETMIFDRGESGSSVDGLMWRYETLEEAEIGHTATTKMVESYLLAKMETEHHGGFEEIPISIPGHRDNIIAFRPRNLGNRNDSSGDFRN